MADLPPGQGHAKHSDPTRVEATASKRKPKSWSPQARAQAVREGREAPTNGEAPKPPVQQVGMHARDLAAALGRFDVEMREREFQLQTDIKRQLVEMNYYLRVLAEGKATAKSLDSGVKAALEAVDGRPGH